MKLRHSLAVQHCIVFLITMFLSISASGNTAQQTYEEQYQRAITAAYRELSEKAGEHQLAQPDYKTLVDQVNAHNTNKSFESAAIVIAANLKLVKQHINAKETPDLMWVLLQQQAKALADELIEQAKAQNDDFLLSRLKLQLAKYYAEQGNWNEAVNLLNSFNISNSLPSAEADEAAIIIGAALQYQKKHRKAFDYYTRIKPESIHYRTAQLNLATAYIRQDWWTDAHIALKSALATSAKPYDDLANRLLTVLGFSQLQQGFYRDSRETFKNVYIKSQYAEKALLGLGLAALQQEDFIGALNAFDHLRLKLNNGNAFPESYLLSAFALNKLNQKTAASARYTEAIDYYEKESANYRKLINTLAESKNKALALNPEIINTIELAVGESDPSIKLIKSKISNIQKLSRYSLSSANSQSLKNLYDSSYHFYFELAERSLIEKQTTMENLLGQSRFGLAKLYDTK